MKRIFIVSLLILFISCSKSTHPSSTPCGTYNGHNLYKGSQGGCYYLNSNGTKEYVDRPRCRC
jgi:hypothetical protein